MDIPVSIDLNELGELSSVPWFILVLLALLTYSLNERARRNAQRDEARLRFLEAQLRDLYGPLYAITKANELVYRKFREHNPDVIHEIVSTGSATGEAAETWRRWNANVFQPANLRMRDIIERNAHLFTSAQMPEHVVKFLAHVENYQAVIQDMEAGDRIFGDELIPYPENFATHIESQYALVSRIHGDLVSGRGGLGLNRTKSLRQAGQ
ncbi:MAG: hypothetical protein ACFE0P_10320 [Oceanicaulis sp.]